MQIMIVAMHAQNHQLFFSDAAAAEREFVKFQDRLSEDRFGRNREKSPTHTVCGDEGEATFVVEKVEAVRLVDSDAEDQVRQTIENRLDARELDRKIAMKRAWDEAFPKEAA